jgi:cytoskeletal protein RodZ
MNRFLSVFVAFVLAVCVASPVFADDVASSPASVASSPASVASSSSSAVASSPASVASSSASVASSSSSAVASSPAPTASPAPATIIEKPLSDYTPTEGLLLVICIQLVFFFLFALLKWRFA